MNYKGFEFTEDESFSSIHKRLLRRFNITDYNVKDKTLEELNAFQEFEKEVKKIWLNR